MCPIRQAWADEAADFPGGPSRRVWRSPRLGVLDWLLTGYRAFTPRVPQGF